MRNSLGRLILDLDYSGTELVSGLKSKQEIKDDPAQARNAELVICINSKGILRAARCENDP